MFSQVTDNVGEAEMKGFEIEIDARPTDGLSITASMGHTDFSISKLDASVIGVTKNSEQPHTPEYTGNIGIAYSWNLGGGEMSLRGEWIYEDSSFMNIANVPALEKPATDRYNARLSYSLPDSGWDITLFGINLTDERYLRNGLDTLDSFGHVEGIYNRPREYGVTVRKHL